MEFNDSHIQLMSNKLLHMYPHTVSKLINNTSDISIDCYIMRMALTNVLIRLCKTCWSSLYLNRKRNGAFFLIPWCLHVILLHATAQQNVHHFH